MDGAGNEKADGRETFSADFDFCADVAALAAGLKINARKIPSPLLGKPAPHFLLPRLDFPEQKISPKKLKTKCGCLMFGLHGALLVALNIRSLRLIKRQSANCGVEL